MQMQYSLGGVGGDVSRGAADGLFVAAVARLAEAAKLKREEA